MLLAHSASLFAVVLFFATIGGPSVFARAWSYHYQPIAPKPSPAASATEVSITQVTPAPAELRPTARLLKQKIISDVALFIQEHSVPSGDIYTEYLVHQLPLFDPMNSPEALGVFADLSGYYLGTRGEELYDCLSLRKGKTLKPYLEQYLGNGNAECAQELGQRFTKPSDALGGYALCPNGQQQKAHILALISEIDSGKSCSDSDLARITANPRPSSADTR
jgi:hypothetical protein